MFATRCLGRHFLVGKPLTYINYQLLNPLAIISASSSHETFQTEPNEENDCVRGSYVSGLTAMDMVLLDRFESGVWTHHILLRVTDSSTVVLTGTCERPATGRACEPRGDPA